MKSLEQLSAQRAVLWLDYVDYAGRLLADDEVPWLDVGAYLAWQRQAQSLLRSDVLMLPVGAVCDAWLAAHPELREAMASKSRTMFPLKTLLADPGLRAHLTELVTGLRGSFADLPLALACPSPRAWVADAYAQAHGADAEAEVGEDEIDSAAVLLADFMRQFGESGIDVLLLQETADREPDTLADVELYQPVLNIATHYRWEVGLYAPGGRYPGGTAGLGFVIAPQALPGARAGRLIAPDYWTGSAPAEVLEAGLSFSRIDPAAAPETVLERLAQLRPA